MRIKKEILGGLAAVLLIMFILYVYSIFKTPSTDLSGVTGKITYGPTAPVCKENVPCISAYEGLVIVKTFDAKSEITRFTTAADGSFKINLPSGNYYLTTESRFISPCGDNVNVIKNKFSSLNLDCDTGIR